MTVMTRKRLADLLRRLADVVESGDSAEGSIQYTYGPKPDEVEVEAALRTGNLQGQGGMTIL